MRSITSLFCDTSRCEGLIEVVPWRKSDGYSVTRSCGWRNRYTLQIMAGKIPHPEIEAMAFINGARQYAWAADKLHAHIEQGGRDPHSGPLYLLMAHAIELALKGYLRL